MEGDGGETLNPQYFPDHKHQNQSREQVDFQTIKALAP